MRCFVYSEIDTSICIAHSTRAASPLKGKTIGVPAKKIRRRSHWSRYLTFKNAIVSRSWMKELK